MRLFVAAYPPSEVREHLDSVVSGLAVARPAAPGRSTRLATADRWHLTMAFIGDVPDERAGRAIAALEAVRGDSADLRLAGGGRFGRGRFTTLWAGVREDRPGALTTLAGAVRSALRMGRLPFDAKPFRPHVTLARPGDRLTADELAGDLARLDAYEGPVWHLDTLRLMRSHLGPHPTYDVLAEAKLS